MKSKIISITLFSILILLIFSFISLISISFFSNHPSVTFLGIFLMIFTIPIILFILLKKKLKIFHIILYLFYFFSTSIITIINSVIIEETVYLDNYSLENVNFKIFGTMEIFIYLLFFTFQLPIIILCLLINNIYKYNENINIKYFIKNPLIYILIFSLSLFPIILFNF